MSFDPARSLSDLERDLLDGFLRFDFEGAVTARTQVDSVRARSGCGCGCGCGTISFALDDATEATVKSGPPGLVPVEGTIVDHDGEVVGGLLLFLQSDGSLESMEVYSSGSPLPLPDPGTVTWWRSDETQHPTTPSSLADQCTSLTHENCRLRRRT
ncbi:hypothetical protein [Nocardioides alkalitolerans]|uniref:hypothetical protein n=1 Tax=Nocardioides alkalitolerans TaxID=281714 RepID=UPI0012F75D30|nr:hypothetical protein [Nocardioides alkalitolerans]